MAKRRILLIEDEESISEPLAAALRREGFDAAVAGTAADGAEAFRTRPPDLVLLDVMLPDGNGIELLAERRAAGDATPVVLISAREAADLRDRAIDAGATDYLKKPFAYGDLLACVARFVERPA
jgi:DNA-binding response OmpR family regulator